MTVSGITIMSFKEEIDHFVKLEEENGDPLMQAHGNHFLFKILFISDIRSQDRSV